MLNAQARGACFRGGLQPSRLKDWHVDQLRGLRTIKEVWLSCDRPGVLPALRRAAERLAWLGRRKIRCYVMVGYGGATPAQDLDRLEAVWDAGCLPFAQPYQPPAESRTNSPELRALVREWSRPAAMFANHPKA